MRIFYDCEFLETGRTIDLISIGLVTEEDERLYLVNDELLRPNLQPGPHSLYRRVTRHQWLMENVVPHLPLRSPNREKTHGATGSGGTYEGFFHLDPDSPEVMPLRVIKRLVRDFILADSDPELWAWYGAFDHVALAWLWGPMIHLPVGVPMWTNDIRTLAMLAGNQARDGAPVQTGMAHNALADAIHNRNLYRHYALACGTAALQRLARGLE